MLTVVDQFSRQTPLLEVGYSFCGRDVVAALDRAIERAGTPTSITAVGWGPLQGRRATSSVHILPGGLGSWATRSAIGVTTRSPDHRILSTLNQ